MHETRFLYRQIWLAFALATGALSARTTIHAVDRNGAPFADVLIVVRSIDTGGELGRYLTDDRGETPPIQFEGGLYRLLAVYPPEPCEALVREVFGSGLGSDFTLQLSKLAPTNTHIQAVDVAGSPFPGVLVIVTALAGNHEIGRYLSGEDGGVPPVRLLEGRYRVTATCPYGICETVTRDVVVGSSAPVALRLELPVKGTDRDGELVDAPRARFRVEAEGVRTSRIRVLVRDPEAHWEAWYPVAADGGVEVMLPSDPAVLVVVRDHCVTTFEVASQCSPRQPPDSSFSSCLAVDHQSVRVPVPACK